MAQADYIISNQTFPNTRADINNHLSAIATNNSGTSAPTTQYAGQFWIDTTTTTWTLYIHDGSDDIQFATIDTSANTVNFIDSALDVVNDTTPQLGGDLDLNSNDITGTGNINITGKTTTDSIDAVGGQSGSTPIVKIENSVGDNLVSFKRTTGTPSDEYAIGADSASLHFKNSTLSTYIMSLSEGGDISFYEDTGTTPKFFWDASEESLGIGTASPDTVLHIKDANPIFKIEDNNETASGSIRFFDSVRETGQIYVQSGASAIMGFNVLGSEAMRIDSSGNVGIRNSTPSGDLHIGSSTSSGETNLYVQSASTDRPKLRLWSGTASKLEFSVGSTADIGTTTNHPLIFDTNNTERMRIESDGDILFGQTTSNIANTGISFLQSSGANGRGRFCTDDIIVLEINRKTSDGDLVLFYQNTVSEGSISVSGSTVSYNGFTGTHWSRLSDNSKPTILKGTILESLDEMCDWYQVQFDITETDDEGNETTTTHKESYALGDGENAGDVITYNYEGTDYQATIIQEGDVKHTKSKISDTVDAKNVYGVFMAWDNDDDTVNDMYVAQTGTFVVRINESETVSKGDLIQSNGDGTGKVQADDLLRASTVAKVLSTTKIETYDDGSYIVPCSLHC